MGTRTYLPRSQVDVFFTKHGIDKKSKDKYTQLAIEQTYNCVNVINRLQLWKWFHEHEKGFVHDDPIIELITKELNDDKHSGTSFAIMMCNMQEMLKMVEITTLEPFRFIQ